MTTLTPSLAMASSASRVAPAVVDGWAPQQAKTVAVCDTQPVTAEGIRTLLAESGDMSFLQATDSLARAGDILRSSLPSILLLDKAFGMQVILDWLASLRSNPLLDPCSRTGIVIWGVSVTEAEALRFLQAGARGILRKTAEVPMVMSCLRTVAAGRSWMEDCVFRESGRGDRYPRSELTSREQQVLELVEQGFKNKDIAQDLGIRPGTVKIHLKHIFEKTGVRGRYGLALNGLRDRGVVAMPAIP
ncbi:MAG TPA: response regulator transcription factor [Bryobacteraceae bacterium]|nr:response regulator transcription factor [Bryobacteraceae bacterium]